MKHDETLDNASVTYLCSLLNNLRKEKSLTIDEKPYLCIDMKSVSLNTLNLMCRKFDAICQSARLSGIYLIKDVLEFDNISFELCYTWAQCERTKVIIGKTQIEDFISKFETNIPQHVFCLEQCDSWSKIIESYEWIGDVVSVEV